jgi:transcriptional regulator with XRE-family HTH domain
VDHFNYVGETLRRIRKEKGKTLEKLGSEAGLGRGQLSRIENSHQAATLGTLDKILTSQGLTRREFFRRYDQVESEMVANRQAEAQGEADPSSRWPEEIQGVLDKVESFVHITLHQPKPVAQGAVEVGDLVVLFRVVPKTSPEARTPEPAKPAGTEPPPAEPPARPAPSKRKRKG